MPRHIDGSPALAKVRVAGIEPATSRIQGECATCCAIPCVVVGGGFEPPKDAMP